MKGLTARLAVAAMVLALAACGGGGGSPGSRTTGGTNTGGGGNTDTGGGGGSTSTSTAKAIVDIRNASNASVTTISLGSANTVRATVTDAAGSPVKNRTVTFSVANAALATLAQTTALTDANGVATVPIAPASVTAVGASTVTVTTTTADGTAVTGSKDFAVAATSVALSNITATGNVTTLASAGNTTLTVTALVGGVASTTPVNVNFTTVCGRINGSNAGLSVTTNGSGVAQVSYTALTANGNPCSGSDTVTATTPGASAQSLALTILAPTASAVNFVSATPTQIFVADSGAVEQSTVKFKVLSQTGSPMIGETVDFTVASAPAGVTVTPSSNVTDNNGEVSVNVKSGSQPGPVKIRATLSGTSIFSETQFLTVASGPPSQRFMDLSVSTFNIEGWAISGTPTKLTARVADRQGNAVEDGTVVNFVSEGGQVAFSCATTKVGNISSCSVDFISQNPRPTGGRVSVLAYTSGTKDYVDVNSNNRYDAGTDTLVNLGDAYRDDNENGVYDFGEFTITRGGATACTGTYNASYPGRDNTCDTSLATTVRQQAVVLFSSSKPLLDNFSVSLAQVSFDLRSFENPLLPMPAGTAVSASTIGATCAIKQTSPTSVPNVSPGSGPSADLATRHTIFLDKCASGDTVIITIKSPSGIEHSVPVTL